MNKQLALILANIAQKRAEMQSILTKAVDDSRTPNDDEELQIQEIESDIAKLEKNAERLKMLIKSTEQAQNTLTPAHGETPEQANATANGEKDPVKSVEVSSNLPKGRGFTLLVKAVTVASKSEGSITASELLKSWNAPQQVLNALQEKATMGTTDPSNWGGALVDYTNLTNEFIELMRQKTVVDKLANHMRQVPFNVKLPSQTASSVVSWVGEGKAKPATNPNFGNITLTKAKIAGIVVLSDELVRFSNPKADQLVQDDLVYSIAKFIDEQFFDENKAEATESPASVTNGVVAINSTGVTADKYDTDFNSVIKQMVDAGVSLEGAYWAMSETRAMQLSGLRDPLGRPYFEGMALVGERALKGLPVLTSGALADKVVLIVPSQILLADDGLVDFSVSNEATIDLGDGSPVNLFQNNATAIRAERFIRWKKRHANAVGFIKYSG